MFIHQITKVFFLGSLQETPFPRESHVADEAVGPVSFSCLLLKTSHRLACSVMFVLCGWEMSGRGQQ